MGAVIRDNEGRVTVALSKHLPLPLGPLEAEAKAMEEGVIFAWDVGIQEVIVECDSQIVAEALNGVSEPPTTISNIIEEICHKFQEFRRYKYLMLEDKATGQHTSWLKILGLLLIM